jgi:hypothetical protein
MNSGKDESAGKRKGAIIGGVVSSTYAIGEPLY